MTPAALMVRIVDEIAMWIAIALLCADHSQLPL